MNRFDHRGPSGPRFAPNAAEMILGLVVLMLATGAFADTRPNVILVMADDMGWAQTGYYGHPVMKTPAIRRPTSANGT